MLKPLTSQISDLTFPHSRSSPNLDRPFSPIRQTSCRQNLTESLSTVGSSRSSNDRLPPPFLRSPIFAFAASKRNLLLHKERGNLLSTERKRERRRERKLASSSQHDNHGGHRLPLGRQARRVGPRLRGERGRAPPAAEIRRHQRRPRGGCGGAARRLPLPCRRRGHQAEEEEEPGHPAGRVQHHGSAATKFQPSRGLTREDLLSLPTGPRQRSAEELDRSRLGGGFNSYGSGRYGSNNSGEDSSSSRWGSSRVSEDSRRQGGFDREASRESLPSRADEIDDWSATKKSTVGNGFERRERGGFFSSQSKADESDSWVSNKSSEPRRFGGEVSRERRGFSRGGFEGSNGGSGGTDADRWGRRKEDEGSFGSGTDADRWGRRKEDEGSFGSGTDADKWGKRKEDEGSFGGGGGADADKWGKRKEDEGSFGSSRPKLNLQPRTMAVSDGAGSGSGAVAKPKASSPFGEARPREEVLKEKGQDWKEIDEKLDTMKIKEVDTGDKAEGSFGRRSFGSGNGRANLQEERTEGTWRKNDSNEVTVVTSPSVEKDDNGVEGN
ncbi:hypothetical protein BT93_I1418 [Corymbia citriodora subsp. variegata]|nr:hypothetical protein BT93_I1418 [Corymbia citriodora subsp. variegata]